MVGRAQWLHCKAGQDTQLVLAFGYPRWWRYSLHCEFCSPSGVCLSWPHSSFFGCGRRKHSLGASRQWALSFRCNFLMVREPLLDTCSLKEERDWTEVTSRSPLGFCGTLQKVTEIAAFLLVQKKHIITSSSLGLPRYQPVSRNQGSFRSDLS